MTFFFFTLTLEERDEEVCIATRHLVNHQHPAICNLFKYHSADLLNYNVLMETTLRLRAKVAGQPARQEVQRDQFGIRGAGDEL